MGVSLLLLCMLGALGALGPAADAAAPHGYTLEQLHVVSGTMVAPGWLEV